MPSRRIAVLGKRRLEAENSGVQRGGGFSFPDRVETLRTRWRSLKQGSMLTGGSPTLKTLEDLMCLRCQPQDFAQPSIFAALTTYAMLSRCMVPRCRDPARYLFSALGLSATWVVGQPLGLYGAMLYTGRYIRVRLAHIDRDKA